MIPQNSSKNLKIPQKVSENLKNLPGDGSLGRIGGPLGQFGLRMGGSLEQFGLGSYISAGNEPHFLNLAQKENKLNILF